MNVFCLIVDALSFPYATDKFNAMPFFRSLQTQGRNCVNMYSQGPYTEAALTPFYTGRDNMDFGGNLFRGQQANKTVFESFDENGYEVLNYTQPLIYPKSMHRGINNERYGVCYFFSAVWDYRLSYYAELYKEKKLTTKDWDSVVELVEANLTFWIEYLRICRDNEFQADFINKYSNREFDFDKVILQVNEQLKTFSENKAEFIKHIFLEGNKHEIFQIENYFMTQKSLNAEMYDTIKKEYGSLFRKIEKFNSKHNKSAKYSPKALMKICLNLLRGRRSKAIDDAKEFYYHKKIRATEKEIRNMFKTKSNYKPEPTMLKYFEHFCDWEKGRDTTKPFYCMMHVSDLHTPEVFFSIDSDNVDEVRKEFSVINEFLDSLPCDFDGNVMYWLSMRYVDMCMEKVFEEFRERDMWNDTLFVITADHGSSFGFRPIRTSLVNNEHDENYHIPCLFFGQGVESKYDDRFFTTKDICKTILEFCGITDETFSGHSVFDMNYKSDYAITEYLGAGCPDIARRPIVFIIRNKKYAVCMKQKISEEFSVENIYRVYDRQNDPSENTNIKDTVKIDEIKCLIDQLERRFLQIKGANS